MAENSLLMFEVILFSEISGCPADPLLFISGGPSENQSAAGHRTTAYVQPCNVFEFLARKLVGIGKIAPPPKKKTNNDPHYIDFKKKSC